MKSRFRLQPLMWFRNLPGLLTTVGILQILLALAVYTLGLDHTRSFELWIVSISLSTGVAMLAVPRLKQRQQVLEQLVKARTAALQMANAQLAQEIEDRKQIEAKLRRREATLEKVQDIAHIGSWEADIATRHVIWSEELYRIHGLDPSRPAPNPQEGLMLIHPDDLWIHQQHIIEPVRKGQPFAADLRIVRPNGEVRFIEARGEPIFDENNQQVRYLGMSRDLTERKLTEEKLRKSEALLKESQAAAKMGGWEHDLSTRQTTWTEGLYHIHGLDPSGPPPTVEELAREVIHLEDVALYQEQIVQAFWQAQPFKCDFRIVRQDGEIRWVTAQGEPIFDPKGNVSRYVGIVLDISERKQIELEMQRAKEVAESASQAKSTFLSSMSHELRTPLNAILGFTQLLNRDTTLTSEQQDYVDTINRNGQHLLELINDVLEVSKIEAGQIILHKDSFDLHQLLDNLKELFYLKATAKQIILTVERAETVPQYIQADASKLRQVLINLLSNAIKFTTAGQVTLRVREQTPEPGDLAGEIPYSLYFEVQDTGCGIAPEETDQLFQAFSQTSSARQASEGTGLGLAISRRFVELMQGDIGVRSVLGQGSTFWFTIPAESVGCDRIPVPLPSRRVIGIAPGQPTYRILVVEDQPENVRFLTKLLTLVGFEVAQAANGQEGIALWKRWSPHLILMDMRMPVMDGYTASHAIKATPEGQDTVIIAVTGSAFEEDRDRILAMGCDDFIRKPFQENLLFARIAHHLGVQYCYDDTLSDAFSQPASLVPLSADALTVMPSQWVMDLGEAARECNEADVSHLLAQIPAEYEPLQIALKQLATNFRFEEIVTLTHLA